ncbi:YceI family protein [Pseudooceanicola algae]|uniref:Protein YceI n=1 Tax=Pseudooceanicola algae TaxID=1537215 RepID=A0A418SC17_9RHOB|nr:YceI family protein [Pseudooceanicola algae]QPM89943.1 Protein YceI [Pseudooceanicola algae]
MRQTLLLSASLVLLAAPSRADPARYELDPSHTTVSFLVSHAGYAGRLGLFSGIEGAFTYDMDTQALSDLKVRVRTDTVITLNEARDQHLRSGDFLNVSAHPVMTFTADGGTPKGDNSGTVEGTLTLLGESRPLTLEVTLNKAEAYPFGHKRFVLGLSARGSVRRSDFGMRYGVDNGLVGDEVQITIETEAMRVE